ISNASKKIKHSTHKPVKKHSANDTNGRHKNACNHRQTKTPAYNTGLAKMAVQYSAYSFVVNQSLVLRINICGEKPAHRKSAERCKPSPYHNNS
ncbi:MAG: hypothetical protein QM535_22040, partial [Limnohabitans sp.]|nr:hypothetical protein [Limnohabitans sp.]